MCKIGILGGTFNPIHLGHIKIALEAKKQYDLDKVIFLTSGNPPHKQNQTILDGKIRHIMVKRALKGYNDFFACDWEVNRKEYSYTLDSLMHFKEIYPNDELYFIIGGDSLRDFDKWHKPLEIKKLCTILVYDRDDGSIESDFAKVIKGEKFDVSSSRIREKIAKGEDVSKYLPAEVLSFILRNHLYQNVPDFEKKLKTMLKPERFSHSLGVRDMAVELAKIYGCDVKKAEIAGLLHDNAKNMPDFMEKCKDLEVELDEIELQNPALIHAKLGAETAKCEFGVSDSEIIDAIRWHTIGRTEMSLLEKIVFVADLTEMGRTFPDVKMIRNYAKIDLDKALYECVKSSVRVNKKDNKPIHPNAYNIMKEFEKKINKKP